jgi:rhodanese-related sulfurtransferase
MAKGNRKVAPPATPQGTARALQADPARTLYLFDVRTPEEYEAGHLAELKRWPELARSIGIRPGAA